MLCLSLQTPNSPDSYKVSTRSAMSRASSKRRPPAYPTTMLIFGRVTLPSLAVLERRFTSGPSESLPLKICPPPWAAPPFPASAAERQLRRAVWL